MFIEREAINLPLLDEQLRVALGAVFVGVSAVDGGVVIHLNGTADAAQTARARQIARDHDASAKTAWQAAQQARQQKLAAARASINADLAPELLGTADPALLTIARYVAWLEQEIRDLRGG